MFLIPERQQNHVAIFFSFAKARVIIFPRYFSFAVGSSLVTLVAHHISLPVLTLQVNYALIV